MHKVDVVVIDDDEGVRWALQQVLSLQNISCSVARNGPEGLKIVARCKPRLTIVDIKLGPMNGLDVARSIAGICDDIKILFITGYGETITGKVDPGLPVVGIVEKPFNIHALLKLVQGVLESGSQESVVRSQESGSQESVVSSQEFIIKNLFYF